MFDIDLPMELVFQLNFCRNHPLKDLILADYYEHHKGKKSQRSERFANNVNEAAGKFWLLFSKWFLPSISDYRLLCRELGLIWAHNITSVANMKKHCEQIHLCFNYSLDERDSGDVATKQGLGIIRERVARERNEKTRYTRWSKAMIDTVFPDESEGKPRTLINTVMLQGEFTNPQRYLHTICRMLRELKSFAFPVLGIRPEIIELVPYLGQNTPYAQNSTRNTLNAENFADRRYAALKNNYELREAFLFSGFDFAKGLGALCERAIRGANKHDMTYWLQRVTDQGVVLGTTSVPFVKDGTILSARPVCPDASVSVVTQQNYEYILNILKKVSPDVQIDHHLALPPSKSANTYPPPHESTRRTKFSRDQGGFGPADSHKDAAATRASLSLPYTKISDSALISKVEHNRSSGIPLTEPSKLVTWGEGENPGGEGQIVTTRAGVGRGILKNPPVVFQAAKTEREQLEGPKSSRRRFVPKEFVNPGHRRSQAAREIQLEGESMTAFWIAGGAALLLAGYVIAT